MVSWNFKATQVCTACPKCRFFGPLLFPLESVTFQATKVVFITASNMRWCIKLMLSTTYNKWNDFYIMVFMSTEKNFFSLEPLLNVQKYSNSLTQHTRTRNLNASVYILSINWYIRSDCEMWQLIVTAEGVGVRYIRDVQQYSL